MSMSGQRKDSVAQFARRHRLVGRSPAFMRSLRLIEKLADCDATVLIRGDTGTGKELAARAIHYAGHRAKQPFIPVNCGAIADGLIESELFGAERGAFTDAKEKRAGLVAQADGGTLLLDEIDMLDAKAQVVLLRFMEDHEYRPLGGRTAHADVRIIAASNRCLPDLVERGQFRQDLLFRLDLVCLSLPSLHERDDDVVILAQEFSRCFAREYGKPVRALLPRTVDAFLGYSWPGNVRELQNLIHRQFLISDTDSIDVTDPKNDSGAGDDQPALSSSSDANCDFKTAKAHAIARFEKSYLSALLRRANGNVSRAARISGKERSALGKLMKKHGLAREQFLRTLN